MKKKKQTIFICLAVFVFSSFFYAQNADFNDLLAEILSVASPSGYEEAMVQKIIQLLPKDSVSERDNLGSLYLSFGSGSGHLAVLTSLDEVGYIVSGIDPRGYLTLDRVVSSPYPIFDSMQFGHPFIVWTEKGPVSGVLALPSLHIISSERRRGLQELFSLDNAFLDIGASSTEEVREKGVRILDPVTPQNGIINLTHEKKAGYSIGNKSNISVLLSLARELKPEKLSQKTTFVWMAQTKFFYRRSRPAAALGALRVKKNLLASDFLIVGVYPCESRKEDVISVGKGPVLIQAKEESSELAVQIEKKAREEGISLQRSPEFVSPLMSPFLSENGEAVGLFLPAKFSSTPAEVVDFKDVLALKTLLQSLMR